MQHSSPRVLVLEDDEQVRDVVTEMLSGDGIEVDGVANSSAALRKIETTQFDLIVTDINLPGGIDGIDTVRCARRCQPYLRSLFISGYGKPRLDDPEADDFVAKPFSSRELLGCVWELLLRDLPHRHAARRRCKAEWRPDANRRHGNGRWR